MKKMILLFAALLSVSALQAQDDRPIRYEEVPAAARQVISRHFPKAKVSHSSVDREAFGRSYDVFFEDGTKIEFDSKGNWKEIDCGTGSVPTGLLPKAIQNYVRKHFSSRKVTSISRDNRGYDVELDNRLEIEFDKRGNFRKMDN